MKQKFIYAIGLLATSLVILNACQHEILYPGNGGGGTGGGGTGGGGTGGGGTGAVNTCSPDTVYFVNDIMPLISSNCTMAGCHDVITHAEGVDLTSYTKIMRYVSAGNASGSKLYKEVIKTGNSRMPPPPMPAFTTAQKTMLQKWINQGAKNNSCVGRCDTATFTYSAAIKPMMDAKCTGCHNPANLGGNIDVSTYAALKVIALNGKLYGSVAHQSGFSAMPKSAAKMSDCEITQVQKWIANGSLNN